MNKLFMLAALLAGLSASPFLATAQQPAPDNTAVNKRDQKTDSPTADQGKNKTTDLQLAREIRRDVVKDKTLSMYGHNVKIIAQSGKVTLKGPVKTEAEKKIIADYADKYAGQGNVVNELSVKGESK